LLRKNVTKTESAASRFSGSILGASVFMMQAAENEFGTHLMITGNLMFGENGRKLGRKPNSCSPNPG
jgi:hypothetical protein